MDDRSFMEMALALAEKGRGDTSPNPMVGAVVVRGKQVVGQGYHRAAGTPHAEVNAIDDAGTAACGATLYVTLEPCNHFGRTPPCTEKIIAAGIRRVVSAMGDPNPRVAGGGHDRLRSEGIEVTTGVLEKEARRLNEVFIKHATTGRPFVMAKWAATLDGQIATRSGDARWVSGPASRAYVHRLRHWADAIMVGIGTVRADNPRLTTRLEGRQGRDAVRIILDTHLGIPTEAAVLRPPSDSDTLIVAGETAAVERIRRLNRPGVEVLIVPEAEGRIDLTQLMGELGRRGIGSILLEGGARVMASALSAGIVDKIYGFYAPKILAGTGMPICIGPGPEKMGAALPVRDIRIHRFENDLMIEGYL